MEYSTTQSNNLGNSSIQGVLLSSLNSEKYTSNDEKNNVNVLFQPSGSFFSLFMDNNKKSNNNGYGFVDISENDTEMIELETSSSSSFSIDINEDNKYGKFNFIKDPINSFFIGSFTVVGLFVLFRFLQKNK